MDGFPSGQRGQTVNLLQIASVVRIHLHPLRWRQISGIHLYRIRNHFYPQLNNIAGWSSLEARRAHNPKVVGSNPAPAIRVTYLLICPDSSVGRAEDWKSSCHWFDSGSGHFAGVEIWVIYFKIHMQIDGVLAQSVEHLTFNQVVRGSNPRCLMLEAYKTGISKRKALQGMGCFFMFD